MDLSLTPISFENGAVFTYSDNKNLELFLIQDKQRLHLIRDHDKSYYATVTEVSQLGFTAGRRFFNKIIKHRIHFKECTITQYNDPNAEASVFGE